jgi:hypothetical protein
VPPKELDPVVRAKFRVDRSDRVATAGSCFAQHIAKHLSTAGFNYFVTEQCHPFAIRGAAEFNYGTFTARYGNIYVARQFLQLLERAYGLFEPIDDIWWDSSGRLIDPYRPQIQPNGFSSEREFYADRDKHFAAVRRMVEESDVMIFTLGLTEGWENIEDGAIYPLCPGTASGNFNEKCHRFVNFRVGQILEDLGNAFQFIRDRNSRIRFIVTVSPVPLVATAEDRHVLVSTTYSKSVLRTVCGELEAQHVDVDYFPSYEIITGNYNKGAYYAQNLRDITESGVQHVMRLFMLHYAAAEAVLAGTDFGLSPHSSVDPKTIPEPKQDLHKVMAQVEEIAKVICDEVALDPE